MALPSVSGSSYPTVEELRNQILSDIRYAYAQRGIVANVEVGSDHYIRATAFANRASIAIRNNQLALQNFSPLTASGDDLENIAGVFGITRRLASKATGFVVVSCVGTVTIPQAYVWIAPNGEKYQTITSNTVTNGDSVEVIAQSTGAATNQTSGTVGTWASASLGALKQNATVSDAGITGGAEDDDDETIRARLIRKLSTPQLGGNAAQIQDLAEGSSAAIEEAFVYAAVRGPGSFDVALAAASGDRTLSPATIATAENAIVADYPGPVDINVTTVDPQPVDVVLNTTLPLPLSAGGSGGGWKDGTPWPSTNDVVLSKVTAKGSGTLTVNSTSSDPPYAGVHFAIWDDTNQRMLKFVASTIGGSTGAYVITVDGTSDSTANVSVGDYVSADAANLSTYATEFAALVAALGPGEKTTSPEILPRGRRQPPPDIDRPASLSTIQLAGVTSQHSELLNLEYAARYASGTTTTVTGPSVTSTVSDPPKIITLHSLAFRAQL